MDADPSPFDMIWESSIQAPEDLDLDRYAEALQNLLGKGDFTVSILMTDDAPMTALNTQYRGKAYATDVLSFPNDTPVPMDAERFLGDIAISVEQAERQAAELGQTLSQELRFLLLHGVLHLLGYDHETDQGEMLAYQSELKAQLHPYFGFV